MPRPPALTADELDHFLAVVTGLVAGGGQLVRRATATSFPEAIGWVVAVADAAERADHHPDIDIRWRTVTFRLSTHDVGRRHDPGRHPRPRHRRSPGRLVVRPSLAAAPTLPR